MALAAVSVEEDVEDVGFLLLLLFLGRYESVLVEHGIEAIFMSPDGLGGGGTSGIGISSILRFSNRATGFEETVEVLVLVLLLLFLAEEQLAFVLWDQLLMSLNSKVCQECPQSFAVL